MSAVAPKAMRVHFAGDSNSALSRRSRQLRAAQAAEERQQLLQRDGGQARRRYRRNGRSSCRRQICWRSRSTSRVPLISNAVQKQAVTCDFASSIWSSIDDRWPPPGPAHHGPSDLPRIDPQQARRPRHCIVELRAGPETEASIVVDQDRAYDSAQDMDRALKMRSKAEMADPLPPEWIIRRRSSLESGRDEEQCAENRYATFSWRDGDDGIFLGCG